MKILHCPTEDMVADFYTKPLQRSIFVKHRNSLLGINGDYMPTYVEYHKQYMTSIGKSRSVNKCPSCDSECVEANITRQILREQHNSYRTV